LGYPAAAEEVLARLQRLLEDNEHAVFVAELPGGRVVGWVHGYIYKLFYSELITEVAGLVVDKDCRGQGVGKVLMTAVEGWAKEKDCVIVSLRSNIIRKEAHAFYKNIGYEIVKEQYTIRKKI
jgi:GNAT superfamily N-acetyltransferase